MNSALFFSALSRHQGISLLNQRGDISYPELLQTVDDNVHILTHLGYRPGAGHLFAADVVLGWRLVPLLLAAIRLGVTFVPFDSFHSSAQAKMIHKELRPELVLTERNVHPDGRIQKQACTDEPRKRPELDDVMFLLYTSGTTGNAKAVMLTYDNIWSNVSAILQYFQLDENDRMLVVRPLTHASALTGELLPALFSGCCMFVKKVEMSLLPTIPRMQDHRISILCTTPTIASSLAERAKKADLTSLRTLVLSGECLGKAQYEKITSGFPDTRVWNAYGLTEASPRISCRTGNLQSSQLSSVGTMLAGVEARVVDDHGHTLQAGEKGELIVRGANVMKGYWNDPGLTSVKIRDGWLYTSDLASIDQGELHIYGRKDDCIIRGGLNMHPSELENILTSLAGVHDALVFAKADGYLSRIQVHAWIVSDPDLSAAKVMKKLLDLELDSRLWPDKIERKPGLPRTASGKLLRPRSIHE